MLDKYIHSNLVCLLHFPIELQHNLNYDSIYIYIYLLHILFILLYIILKTLHLTNILYAYLSRLVTFNLTNVEFQIIHDY